jgi:hypothetical protein
MTAAAKRTTRAAFLGARSPFAAGLDTVGTLSCSRVGQRKALNS